MLKKSGLSVKTQELILRELQKYPEIEKVILYGSRALQTFQKGSDIDLAIQGKKVTDQICTALHYQLEEEVAVPYFFDITNYENLTNQNLKEHIDKYGIIFYKK